MTFRFAAASVVAFLAAALANLEQGAAWAADLPLRQRHHHRHACKCPKPKPETCEQKAKRLQPIDNTIESTVIIAFGMTDNCFLPSKLPRLVSPDQPVRIKVRHVFNDALLTPLTGRALRMSIVDSFGFTHPKRILSTDRVRTKNDGFADQEVIFSASDPGVYRIRVDYTDRDVANFVMSPNIIVIVGGAR